MKIDKTIRLWVFIFFIITPIYTYSQEIKWTTVPYELIYPSELMSVGNIKLDNGDVTPNADLYIDFENEKIFYRNSKNNVIFSIFKEDFSKISVFDYKKGEMVRDYEFYGDLGEEIGASIRKKLYDKVDLNVLKITSVQKEGFFNRKQPKFYINNSGNLDVSNKSTIVCKVISIGTGFINYLDSDGDLWTRNNNIAKNISAGDGESKSDKREEKKIARKQARILNINLENESFLNTRELYDYFYEQYEKNFYESLNKFKKDFEGKIFTDILSKWGPFSQQFTLSSTKNLFVWNFERKITEGETSTIGVTSSISSLTQSSSTQGIASISGQYGINTSASKYSLGGYGSVIDSYSSINKTSFLNYYSNNVTQQYSARFGYFTGISTKTEIMVDDTKKIALVVDDKGIIQEVIANDFFPIPYYGIFINFIE